jgi:hypothetical protein
LSLDCCVARCIAGALPLSVVRAVDQLDVRRSLTATADVILDLELHLLAFLDGVEDPSWQGRVMEEDFRTIRTADETEATVSDHPHNSAPHESIPPTNTNADAA